MCHGPARRSRNRPAARTPGGQGAPRSHGPPRGGHPEPGRRDPGANPQACRGLRSGRGNRGRGTAQSRAPHGASHRREHVRPARSGRRRSRAADRSRAEDGSGRLPPRPRRQHADGAPRPSGPGPALPADRQARDPEPWRERQGPPGRGDGRRGRARRAAPARFDHRRGHFGQHRRRAGDRGSPAPLPLRVRHARQDGPREGRVCSAPMAPR